MVIVKILGGFGNQLSAYAWGYSVAKYLDQELVFDLSDYITHGYFRPYCLEKLNIRECRKLIYPPVSLNFLDEDSIPAELRAKGLRFVSSEVIKTREELLEAVKGAENVYLSGYGGIQFCTEAEREEIREQYVLKEPSAALEQFKEQIKNEYSVAVHVRRTDFVSLNSDNSMDYFRAAITYIRMFRPNAQFYFFSDDIHFVKEQFGTCKNYHYVHLLGGMDVDLEEFFCISACTSRILSSKSSYSAWANWLNSDENKLDICYGEDQGLFSDHKIYLNSSAVEALCKLYHAEAFAVVPFRIAQIQKLVYEGKNEEAIMAIDRASLDISNIPQEMERELTMLKAVALAQTGEKGLPAALRTFYYRMQWDNENSDFHANYFLALYQAGRYLESAIHAAMANRFGDMEDYSEYFTVLADSVPAALEVYLLLKNSTPHHFLFAPTESWNYFATYIKSMAVLLARMGNKVTYIHDTINIQAGIKEASDEVLAEAIFSRLTPISNTYWFHINILPSVTRITDEGRHILFGALAKQSEKKYQLPTAIIATHPDVFAEPKADGVKYIIPDYFDPLNREKLFLDVNHYLSLMANRADTIFASGEAYETVKAQYGEKVQEALPVWTGEPFDFFNGEVDITTNYIVSDELIQNAIGLMKAAMREGELKNK